MEVDYQRKMLNISQTLIEQIRGHGAREYPHECCGALLGREEASNRDVLSILPLANQRDDSPRNRFSITPDDVRTSERAAKTQGLELLGWYHSHPDAPARPSEFDREHAWPWYSYIIFRVEQGAPREMRSWRLQDDRSKYDEEGIELIVRAPV